MPFKVVNIIGGDTIEVQGWQWENHKGKFVKIMGYSTPDKDYIEFANKKLNTLLDNQTVDLRQPIKIEKGDGEDNDTLFCSVYLNDINIAQYFPELKSSSKTPNNRLSI